MHRDKIKQIFVNNLNNIMKRRGLSFSDIARSMHDGMEVKSKSDKLYYPFDTLDKKERTYVLSRYEKWGNINSDNLPQSRELAFLCHEVLDCNIDYLFSDKHQPPNDDNEVISEYLDWDEESVSKIKTMHNAYKFFLTQMLGNGSLETIIEAVYRYLQMIKVQNITLNEEGVGSKQFDDKDLNAIASYQASNIFSLVLTQLSNDDLLNKYILAGHSLEVFSNDIKNGKLQKALESAMEKIKYEGKTFNQLCDEENLQ